jgi:hypothetical protein
MAFYNDASIITIPSGYKAGTLYSQKPTDASGDMAFTRTGDTASRVNSSGIIERCITNLLLNSATLSTQSVTLTAQPYTLSFFGTGSVTLGGTGSGTLTGTGASDRVSLTFTPTAGSVSFTVSGSVTSAQLQTGDIPTNYIATAGAAVTQGPVTNLPRLDYFGTTCPQLLLEPARTNLVSYSQMLNNAAWVKSDSATVSGNVAVSPDGYTNADLVIGGGSSINTRIHNVASIVNGTTYNFSAFVKQGVDNISTALKILQNSNANIAAINIFFTAGVPTITTTGITTNTKIENYGNGWYRISGNFVSPVTQSSARLGYYADNSGTNKSSYLWGAQVEAGAYVTSYIPTTSATVTRNQDLFAKASITSLLGQTEGTLFLDFTFDRQFVNADVLSINDASTSNRVSIGVTASNTLTALVTSAGVDQATITRTIAVGTRYKCAIAYKLNDFVLYVNGVQAGTDTLGSVPVSLTRFSNDAGTTSTTPFDYPFNQALVFKTRLTNAELATLTTL